MNGRNTAPAADIEVILRGDIPAGVRSHARQMISDLARYSRDPILHARVRLTRSADPASTRPVIAQANLDVNGRQVRAQVATSGAGEGIDLLSDMLRRRLPQLVQHWQARRGGMPAAEPHEWRHGSEPTQRPDYFPRPVEQRRVVRHKAYELALVTPDEAIDDLDLMDYQFQLFTDLDTGRDSVVYRDGPTGYRIAQATPDPDRTWTTAVPLTVSRQPAPILTVPEAIERLNITGLPFLFYADEATARGRVLYRRYDGHYGLITPAG